MGLARGWNSVTGYSHVFNVVNDGGLIKFIDITKDAGVNKLGNFTSIEFLPIAF